MTSLLHAIRLDHQIMRPRYPMLLALLAIGISVGAISESPLAGILLVTLISAPIGGSYFATYESSRLDHLYGTLPLKRSAAAAAIYLYSVILVVVNGLLATLIAWQVGLRQHTTLSGTAAAVALSLSLLGACIYIGLLYPVYLMVPFSKVYILSNVPFYVVTIALIYLAKRTDWLNGLDDFTAAHPGWASVLAVAAGLAVLAVSWSIAQAIATRAQQR
jgi:glucan phosphoethanolaminetransferase (alkaline phosphatase superfamily)